MKSIPYYLVFFLFGLFPSLSSAQDKPVYIHVNHLASGNPISYTSSYSNRLGQNYRFSRIEYYMSRFRMYTKGNEELLIDTIYLVNGGKSADFLLTSNAGFIPDSLSFYFGVDSLRNHSDPALYPYGHPLGPQLYSMHWDWASGYRFWAVEGKADTSDGSFPIEFQYHIAIDQNYLKMVVGEPVVQSDTIHYYLNMDYAELMYPVDFSTNNFIHGGFGGPFDAPLDSMLQRVRKGFVLQNGTARILSVSELSTTQFKLYPNPASDELTLVPAKQGPARLTIFNSNGLSVWNGDVPAGEDSIHIPIANLSSGMYLIRCIYPENGSSEINRFLITR